MLRDWEVESGFYSQQGTPHDGLRSPTGTKSLNVRTLLTVPRAARTATVPRRINGGKQTPSVGRVSLVRNASLHTWCRNLQSKRLAVVCLHLTLQLVPQLFISPIHPHSRINMTALKHLIRPVLQSPYKLLRILKDSVTAASIQNSCNNNQTLTLLATPSSLIPEYLAIILTHCSEEKPMILG